MLCLGPGRLMAVLARDSPLRARLRMDAWLEQLLYIAADAAATVSTPCRDLANAAMMWRMCDLLELGCTEKSSVEC